MMEQLEQLKDQIKQAWSEAMAKLDEQAWYQELKEKWEQLDARQRMQVQIGAAAAATLLVLAVIGSTWWGVRRQRLDMFDTERLLTEVRLANDELGRLRESGAAGGAAPEGESPIAAYVEQLAQGAGIAPESLDIGAEQPAPATAGGVTQESLFQVSLKKVNLRQVVRLAFQLENGARPVKLRNLTVDTKMDPEGYMDAKLALSSFATSASGAKP